MQLTRLYFITHTQLGVILQKPFDDMMLGNTKKERRGQMKTFVHTLRLLKIIPKGTVEFIGSGLNEAGEPGIIIALEGSIADVIAETVELKKPTTIVEFEEDIGTFYELEYFRGAVFNQAILPGVDGDGFYAYMENGKRFYDRARPVSLPLTSTTISDNCTHVAWFNK
jgi:hypothetical protein